MSGHATSREAAMAALRAAWDRWGKLQKWKKARIPPALRPAGHLAAGMTQPAQSLLGELATGFAAGIGLPSRVGPSRIFPLHPHRQRQCLFARLHRSAVDAPSHVHVRPFFHQLLKVLRKTNAAAETAERRILQSKDYLFCRRASLAE
jgi:hypothetical protein